MSTTTTYEDAIDLVGEVTMARVSIPGMSILLSDGREVEAPFDRRDEAVITMALRDHQTTRLRVVGRGQFDSEGKLVRVIEVSRVELLPAGEVALNPAARPIWEEIAEILAEVPPEAFDALPLDGSFNHDHYLYGAPRKQGGR